MSLICEHGYTVSQDADTDSIIVHHNPSAEGYLIIPRSELLLRPDGWLREYIYDWLERVHEYERNDQYVSKI